MILFLKKSHMPRGRKTSLTIRLTPAERATLHRLSLKALGYDEQEL